MSRGPDAAVLLERALAASAGRARCPIRVTAAGSTRWASATFAGARHELTLAADPSPALDAWLAGLPDAEFALRGHLVADLVVESMRRVGDAITITLEALTVEEG